MGVRGLQTFLKNNQCFFQNYRLADTDLIVDANNLLCQLFCYICEQDPEQKRNDLLGGNLVAYGQLIRLVFDNFKRCNVRPIFVFDGSVIGKQSESDQKALKIETIYKRACDRFETVKRATETSDRCNVIMPNLLNLVFKRIVQEYGFDRIQTAYEADAHIARLANENKFAPVLSNDSDFVMFSLPVGLIMVDMMEFHYLDFNPPTERGTKHYIPTRILYADSIVRFFPGLDKKSLPLCSVLLGNDFIGAHTFDHVLSRLAPYYQGGLVCQSRSHDQIARVMNWLRGQTPTNAIESLLSFMQCSDKARVRNSINRLLRSYHLESYDNLDKELDEVYPPQFTPEGQETPGEYLRRLMEQLTLSPVILDIIFGNPHIKYITLDDFMLPSYSLCTHRPTGVIITLLRSLGPHKIITELIEWDRFNDELKPFAVQRVVELENFGSLEHINCYTLSGLSFKTRRNLVLASFRSSPGDFSLILDTMLNLFTRNNALQAALICMLLSYIGRETKFKPKKQFVSGVLLCIVFYAVKNGDERFMALFDSEACRVLLFELTPHGRPTSTLCPPHTATYRRVMHFVSQLAAVISSYEMLNTLVDEPMPALRLDRFFNACFIYNITKSLRLSLFQVENLLRGFDSVIETFNVLYTLIDCDQ